MDPLSALSVAGTIIQFVDFVCTVWKEGRSIYKSASGALPANEELELIVQDLQAFIRKVRDCLGPTPTIGPLTRDETVDKYTFERICEEAVKVAEGLVERLNKLKIEGNVDAKHRIHRKWQSFQIVLRSAWDMDELRNLADRLTSLKSALQDRVLLSLRESMTAESIQASSRFDHLDEETKRIVLAILASTENVSKHVSDEIQRQTKIFTETLSQILRRLQVVSDGEGGKGSEFGHMRLRQDHIKANIEMLDVPYDEENNLRRRASQSVINWLFFASMTDRYELVVEAYPKTFEWVFRHSEVDNLSWDNFSEWLKIGKSVYWISGKAGSGKSTLMKHIFDDPRTRIYLGSWAAETPLCLATFFFWNSGTKEQKSLDGLLRTLLHQILQQYPALIPVFSDLWTSYYDLEIAHHGEPTEQYTSPNNKAESITIELMTKFKALVQQTAVPLKIWFLVDGLDEFQGDEDVIEAVATLFKELSNSPPWNVKFCVSSRPWIIFEDLFSSSPCLRLHNLTYNDVELFVNGKFGENDAFRRLAIKEPVMAPALIQEIVGTAQGVFLWVRLVVRSLLIGIRNRDSISILQSRLRLLPRELEPLYSHLLGLIDPIYMVWASKAFQLVRLSKTYSEHPFGVNTRRGLELRTPNLAEFSFAITETADFMTLKDMSHEELNSLCQQTEIFITARCAGLLEVQFSARDHSFYERRVQYLHKTVGDFLEQDIHWLKIIAHALTTSFNANVSMMKGAVLSLSSRTKETDYHYDGDFIIDSILSTLVFAYHAEIQTETLEFQTTLLDTLDELVNDQTDRNGKSIYGQIKKLQPPNGKPFAASNTLRSSKLRLHKAHELCSRQFRERLPLPSPEMTSILIQFEGIPLWPVQGSNAWENVLQNIRSTCEDEKERKFVPAYLTVMEVLVTSIAPVAACIPGTGDLYTAWRTLTKSALRFLPRETKQVLHEIEKRLSPADIAKISKIDDDLVAQEKKAHEDYLKRALLISGKLEKRKINEVSNPEEPEPSRRFF